MRDAVMTHASVQMDCSECSCPFCVCKVLFAVDGDPGAKDVEREAPEPFSADIAMGSPSSSSLSADSCSEAEDDRDGEIAFRDTPRRVRFSAQTRHSPFHHSLAGTRLRPGGTSPGPRWWERSGGWPGLPRLPQDNNIQIRFHIHLTSLHCENMLSSDERMWYLGLNVPWHAGMLNGSERVGQGIERG